MEFSIWLLILFTSVFYVFYHYYRIKRLKFPPGPLAVPCLGVLPFLGQHPEKIFAKWSKKYGPIMSVKLGMNDVVILNDYNTIYQVSVP